MKFDYGAREDGPDIQPLRVVKASPERAFADIRVDKDFSEDLGEFEVAQEQLPLPIASFTRTDMTVDMLRFKSVINRKVAHLRQDKDEAYSYRWPLPYNFTYQVDFWTRYESTLDSIRVWTALQFAPGGNYRFFPVDYSGMSMLYGIQNVFAQTGGLSDTSDLEPGSEQRVERATLTLDVQGWILFPVEIVKTVVFGQIDFCVVPDILDIDDPAAAADENIVETETFDFQQ